LDDYLNAAESRSSAASEPAIVGLSNSNHGPKVRAISADSDEISDLSRNSSSEASFWRKNPISSYLREIEERTQLRKARELERARQRAVDRLKPKELDEVSLSRLEELRLARGRRTRDGETVTNLDVPEEPQGSVATTERSIGSHSKAQESDKHRDWASFWTSHGIITRIIVIQALMSLLVFLLYMDTAFDKFVAFEDGSFYTARGRDAATLLYMGVTGWVHFILCYVSLMYTFSSLQLGTMAGKEAKKFYSQNVHLAVGISSGSMVALGVVKSALNRFFQWAVCQAYSLFHWAQDQSTTLPGPPAVVTSPFVSMLKVMASGLSWSGKLLFGSNFVGRAAQSLFYFICGFFQTWTLRIKSFVDDAISVNQGISESIPWREEAFVLTRNLLSYSATFLLVLLFLFGLSAKRARKEAATKKDALDGLEKEQTQDCSMNEGDPSEADCDNAEETALSTSGSTLERPVSSSQRKWRIRSLTRSLSPAFDTIAEEVPTEHVKTGANSETGTGEGIRFRASSKDDRNVLARSALSM